jgi:hypothetical protein
LLTSKLASDRNICKPSPNDPNRMVCIQLRAMVKFAEGIAVVTYVTCTYAHKPVFAQRNGNLVIRMMFRYLRSFVSVTKALIDMKHLHHIIRIRSYIRNQQYLRLYCKFTYYYDDYCNFYTLFKTILSILLFKVLVINVDYAAININSDQQPIHVPTSHISTIKKLHAYTSCIIPKM